MGNEIHSETDIIRVEEIYENQKNGNKKKEVIFEEKIVKENSLKTEGKRSHMLHGSELENTDWRCGIAHDYVLMADDLYLGLFSSKDQEKHFFSKFSCWRLFQCENRLSECRFGRLEINYNGFP